ncbi:OLC1v1032535C1 [Oldenlandia corymbosa var. corymbosa]|uniref:OLC1v1032535C1 n=1 Tax=Oldenlandia corymbosa var. corymbosa TaxID=529605 RepID=A0AAV1CP79_OLDCO|nr:OLC1v1032535C1 [Oldenlandia corymbosa var. corymbosa]
MSHLSQLYCSLLKHYCETNKLNEVKKLHCFILKTLDYPETYLLNNLINAYGKLNSLGYARNTFDQIPSPNLFSWNSILSAYSKSGDVSRMRETFNFMPRKDRVSWNLIISGYASHGFCKEALKAYKLMIRDELICLNRITLSTMLILSYDKDWIHLARQIHGQIMKCGFMSCVFVGSSLLDMYAKSGLICDAKEVFHQLPEKNVVVYNTMIMGFLRCGLVDEAAHLFHLMAEKDSISWTSMITGLTQTGLEKDAIHFFREMIMEGLAADQFTFGSILTACGGLVALEEVHLLICTQSVNALGMQSQCLRGWQTKISSPGQQWLWGLAKMVSVRKLFIFTLRCREMGSNKIILHWEV